MSAAYTLTLICTLAVILLASGRCRNDLTGLFILCLLLGTGQLQEKEALSGFSNPAVIVIACMLVIASVLRKSGLIQAAVALLTSHYFHRSNCLFLLLLIAALVSGFISNNVTMLIFLPLLLALDQRNGISARQIMLPVAFMIQIAGSLTLVGSSNNLLINSLKVASGRPAFTMFEIAPLTIVLILSALVVFLIAYHIFKIPRDKPISQQLDLSEYLFEVLVTEKSPLVNENIFTLNLPETADLTIIRIGRAGKFYELTPNTLLQAGDQLLVKGSQAAIMHAKSKGFFEILPALKLGEKNNSNDLHSISAIIPAGSRLHKKTLIEVDFHHNYHGIVLAIRRGESTFSEKLGNIQLLSGDQLILLVDSKFQEQIKHNPNLVIFKKGEIIWPNKRKAALGVIALLLPVTLSALGILGLPTACLLSCLLLLACSALTSDEAYQALDAQLLVFIACLLPLSMALEQSGLSTNLISYINQNFTDLDPKLTLLILLIGTSILTELISNAGASALMFPLAIQFSQQLGISSDPLIVGILIAATTSFLVPFGDQFNLLAYQAGNYRWRDFIRLGLPLKIVLLLVSWLVIPVLWPFI